MIRLKHYKYTENKDFVKRVYENSFPLSERFDFAILKQCDSEQNVHLSCIEQDDIPVGMQFTIDMPNDLTYLMYFAIDKEYRNQMIGSKALQNLIVSRDKIMLCIENPDRELAIRRKAFYLRNGLFETGIIFEDTGILYEVLISDKDYKPTVQDLRSRYQCMTSNKLIWRKIRNTFNTEDINFIT